MARKLKSTKKRNAKKRKSDASQTGLQIQNFFIYHGEKIGLVLFIVGALYLVTSGMNYKAIDWQPDVLTDKSQAVRKEIENDRHSVFIKDMNGASPADSVGADSTKGGAESQLIIVDYAKLANQIKKPVRVQPYAMETAWSPSFLPPTKERGGIDVLAAEVECVARRDTDGIPSVGITVKVKNETQERLYREALEGTAKTANPNDMRSGRTQTGLEYTSWVLERAEFVSGKPLSDTDWKPVDLDPEGRLRTTPRQTRMASRQNPLADKVYPGLPNKAATGRGGGGMNQEFAPDFTFQFEDKENVDSGETYLYRVKLKIRNPNYGLSPDSVAEGANIADDELASPWSNLQTVIIPAATTVELADITPDRLEFPRFNAFANQKGKVDLIFFNEEDPLKLVPPVPIDIVRGTVCNVSLREIDSILKKVEKDKNNPAMPDRSSSRIQDSSARSTGSKKNKNPLTDGVPDTGLESNICVADIVAGQKLPQTVRNSPEVSTPAKVMFLYPSGVLKAEKLLSEEERKKLGQGIGGGTRRSYDSYRGGGPGGPSGPGGWDY